MPWHEIEEPRKPALDGASQVSAFASLVRGDCRIRQPIELPSRHVALELLVPKLGIEVIEPRAQVWQFLGRQLREFFLESLDLRHGAHNSTASRRLTGGASAASEEAEGDERVRCAGVLGGIPSTS